AAGGVRRPALPFARRGRRRGGRGGHRRRWSRRLLRRGVAEIVRRRLHRRLLLRQRLLDLGEQLAGLLRRRLGRGGAQVRLVDPRRLRELPHLPVALGDVEEQPRHGFLLVRGLERLQRLWIFAEIVERGALAGQRPGRLDVLLRRRGAREEADEQERGGAPHLHAKLTAAGMRRPESENFTPTAQAITGCTAPDRRTGTSR